MQHSQLLWSLWKWSSFGISNNPVLGNCCSSKRRREDMHRSWGWKAAGGTNISPFLLDSQTEMLNQSQTQSKKLCSAQHKSETSNLSIGLPLLPALCFLRPVCPLFALFSGATRLEACAAPTPQLQPSVGGPAGGGCVLTLLRCCSKFNPHAVRNEPLLLSLLLLQLWSGPNVIRQWPWHDWPGNLKKLRGGRGMGEWERLDLTNKPREKRNYSEGVFPPLPLCLVGNKGFMYSFFLGKYCDL